MSLWVEASCGVVRATAVLHAQNVGMMARKGDRATGSGVYAVSREMFAQSFNEYESRGGKNTGSIWMVRASARTGRRGSCRLVIAATCQPGNSWYPEKGKNGGDSVIPESEVFPESPKALVRRRGDGL